MNGILKCVVTAALIICPLVTNARKNEELRKASQNMCIKYIEESDRVAEVDVSLFKYFAKKDFDASERQMNYYFLGCNRSWGEVAMALAISQASDREMVDVLAFKNMFCGYEPIPAWTGVMRKCGIKGRNPKWYKLELIMQRQLNDYKAAMKKQKL